MQLVLNVILVILASLMTVLAETQPATPIPSAAPQPSYQPSDPVGGYVAHATYPYADSFGTGSGYDGYLVPAGAPSYSAQPDYGSSLAPVANGALHFALKMFAKVGLFLIGGAALLLVGGLFTTAVCSLTPICTITFAGFGGINKETVRSLITPDNISVATNLVQDAITKYQRLQRAANGGR